jgi:ATP-dependent RNA helicase DDX42
MIHGNKAQYDRTVTINQFKQGKYLILVATDLASRGLDMPMIRTVINYDCAKDNETHIHRIGRTGRAGDKDGYAITLILNEDSKSASMILRNFELSGQVITPKLEKLAMSDSSFKNKRMKIGIGKYNITVNINKKS